MLQFFGRISYSIYLVHVCFMVVAQRWFSNSWPAAGAAFLARTGYATTSWFLLERRLIQYEKRGTAAAVSAV